MSVAIQKHAQPTAKGRKMNQPLGSTSYTDHNGIVQKKHVHGLSHCKMWKRCWSQDYVTSLNIRRSFVSYFNNGRSFPYLSMM